MAKRIKVQSKRDKMLNFEVARKLSLQLDPGRMKRVAPAQGVLSEGTYFAATTKEGIHYVLGDTLDDIPKPSCFINGRPALQIKNEHVPVFVL